MDLIGRLSNHDTTALYQWLTSRNWHKQRKTRVSGDGPRPGGRRQFGSVREAILSVLARADVARRVRDIQVDVEQVLGDEVSRSSVKNYLHKGSKRAIPLFEYCGRRGYRLRQDRE
jgi:hypothetical protein